MLIDISRKLEASIAVWPGDAPFRLERSLAIAAGAAVNLTALSLSAHTGTHVDAPYHFDDAGLRMDEVGLEAYWGPAQVVTVRKPAGPLLPEDLAHVALGRAPRLLVRSSGSLLAHDQFPKEFVYPTPELAAVLGAAGVVLYGADTPSMDAVESKALPGHHALRRHGIAILEGLDLRVPPDGVYELVALPLRIVGGDGSPVRAVLRAGE